MSPFEANHAISRRHALALGGGAATALILGPAGSAVASAPGTDGAETSAARASLPAKKMEAILQAKGTVMNGVLSIGLDRTDIGTVSLRGIPIKPAFEVNGSLNFQPVGAKAFFNGDLPLKNNEINRFIDTILANGMVFQAEHQHFYDFDPPVWFIHWRGFGEPLKLARAVHNVLKSTSTPLPQEPPSKPRTPFNADRLKSILRGDSSQVGEDGVVTVSVSRKDPIHIAGILVQPEANIATNIDFQPLNSSGSRAAAAPDFGMVAHEIDSVVRVMRSQGWDIGCLYNQETDESPQLFFSHQIKTGDPYQLAHEIRRGLDHMNTK